VLDIEVYQNKVLRKIRGSKGGSDKKLEKIG
jgi:hypothetical protein